MVATIAGSGLGLDRSSAWVLGSRGQFGASALGRGGDNVYVNAASGNLIVSNTDEMLMGTGQADVVARTYNSLGALGDDNGDNWRESVSRKVTLLSGTINGPNSTVKRVDWDGSEAVFTYDGAKYVAKTSGGAFDVITFAGTTWTWTDGASRVSETYDNANGGRITTRKDLDGNTLTFAYVAGNAANLVSRVTTQSGEYTELVYSGNNLTKVMTYRRANPAVATLSAITRVNYAYDASNRLTKVTVDLSPADNATTDGKVYVTDYTYDGTSRRVSSIKQSDGSSLTIGYTQVGATFRVTSLAQASVGTTTRSTTFSYDTANRVTTVTDALGLVTRLAYDTTGQLLSSTTANGTAAAQATLFTYNAAGDVKTVTSADGSVLTYEYDANGNRTLETNSLGQKVARTYGAANQLLTETRYLDAAGTVAVTTRYSYDGKNHLRFVVDGEGGLPSTGTTLRASRSRRSRIPGRPTPWGPWRPMSRSPRPLWRPG